MCCLLFHGESRESAHILAGEPVNHSRSLRRKWMVTYYCELVAPVGKDWETIAPDIILIWSGCYSRQQRTWEDYRTPPSLTYLCFSSTPHHSLCLGNPLDQSLLTSSFLRSAGPSHTSGLRGLGEASMRTEGESALALRQLGAEVILGEGDMADAAASERRKTQDPHSNIIREAAE